MWSLYEEFVDVYAYTVDGGGLVDTVSGYMCIGGERHDLQTSNCVSVYILK